MQYVLIGLVNSTLRRWYGAQRALVLMAWPN
jgi:hypothetical protein